MLLYSAWIENLSERSGEKIGLFGCKEEEVTGWIKRHNDDRHNLYSSPDTVGVISTRRMVYSSHEGDK
jgi:hypothetical protein